MAGEGGEWRGGGGGRRGGWWWWYNKSEFRIRDIMDCELLL